MRGLGLLRTLAVTATGAALVLGVNHLTEPLDLTLGNAVGRDSGTPGKTGPVAAARVVCPGPEELDVAGVNDTVKQSVSVVTAAPPVQALPAGFVTERGTGSRKITALPPGGLSVPAATSRSQITSATITAPQSVLVVGAGALAPGTVATQRSWVQTGENRGLVMAACMPAAGSSWLIAGGADPGRREHLVLTNPGPNPVTVEVAVLGVKGLIRSPNGHGLVVGPHARSVIALDAITGTEPSPVVHVTVRGGEVAAVLSDTWLDGVVPRGGDDAVPVSGPATEQTLVGLPIGNGRATLRVAVPGDRDAVVESRVLTPSGPKALPAKGVTHLAAHTSTDIDLTALPPDVYAVQVRANVPIVAGAMADRRKTPVGLSDLAWSGASAPITTLAGMALREPAAKNLRQGLYLVATNDNASVLVTTVGDDGKVSSKQVEMSADSVSNMALVGVTSVWVTPGAGVVRAAVVTWFTDTDGTVLSTTPMSNLTLTTTTAALLELRD